MITISSWGCRCSGPVFSPGLSVVMCRCSLSSVSVGASKTRRRCPFFVAVVSMLFQSTTRDGSSQHRRRRRRRRLLHGRDQTSEPKLPESHRSSPHVRRVREACDDQRHVVVERRPAPPLLQTPVPHRRTSVRHGRRLTRASFLSDRGRGSLHADSALPRCHPCRAGRSRRRAVRVRWSCRRHPA